VSESVDKPVELLCDSARRTESRPEMLFEAMANKRRLRIATYKIWVEIDA
jgi:hypothetical protein